MKTKKIKQSGFRNNFKVLLVINYIFIFIVYLYKFLISPIIPGSCRFYPSCSDYAIQALKTHFFGKAFLLIIFRLFKCNPFGGKGYDPVPVKKK